MRRYLYIIIGLFVLFTPRVKGLNGICMIDSNRVDLRQNEEVVINFYIHDINELEINGGFLKLKYDNSVFNFIKVENVYEGFDASISNEDGIFNLNLNSSSYISNVSNNVIIASIRFKVKDDAVNGSSVISMIGENVSYITDTNGDNNNCLSVGNKNLYFNIYNSNNEALLTSLNLSKGILKPNFNSNVTSYSVNVGNSVTNVNVNGSCSVQGCNITGDGNKKLKVGKNIVKVNVASPNNKVTKTYTITINRDYPEDNDDQEDFVKDSNALLKTLFVSEGSLDPGFKPEITEYNVEVESDIKKIRIDGICSGIECTVKGTGNKYLEYGDNTYEIEVVAEDGTTKIYTIKVFRKYDLRLTSLIIETYKLSPKFDEDIYTYKIAVKKDVNKLNITTQSTDPNVMVQIRGNNNFIEGDNVVEIELSYDDTNKKIYTILVNKEGNDKSNIKNDSKSIWDNTYVVIGGIIGGILLFGLMVGIIWFLLKKKNENN